MLQHFPRNLALIEQCGRVDICTCTTIDVGKLVPHVISHRGSVVGCLVLHTLPGLQRGILHAMQTAPLLFATLHLFYLSKA
jgi:hypothetical protein